MQLLANRTAVNSRHINVSKQIASTRQQIATQQNELQRFENLLKSNAANQKQIDDIVAQIAVLEKQLAAQTESLESGNKGISGESPVVFGAKTNESIFPKGGKGSAD
jgi:HlyD family secretion protein